MLNESAPPGKELKYARIERERRFLLGALPPTDGLRAVRMTDRYLVGTRLRLRRAIGGDQIAYKFTQKVPGRAGRPASITTIYLSEAEYRVLAALPASVLTKVRYSLPPLGIDVFEGALSGLYLAEAEFDDEVESMKYTPPDFVVAEVTGDIRFTGGNLVTASRGDIAALVAQFGLTMNPMPDSGDRAEPVPARHDVAVIYKILLPSEWDRFEEAGIFDGSPFDHESGFVHCSSVEQVAATALRFFAGEPHLTLVALDPRALEDVRWEPAASGELFPHVYGPLTSAAVVSVQHVAGAGAMQEAVEAAG